MKKRIALMVLLLAYSLCLYSSAEVPSGKTTFRIEELGLSVSMPLSYIVFTRNMEENDQALSAFGFTKESLSSMLKSIYTYLIAVDNSGLPYEIYISMYEMGGTAYDQMSDKALEATIPVYETGVKKSGSIPSNTEVYHHSQTKFIRHDTVIKASENNAASYGIQYSTSYDGKWITVSMRTDSEEVRTKIRPVFEEIVESINFEKIPISGNSEPLAQELKEVSAPVLSDNYKAVAGQEAIYSVKELSATVMIPDGYDVFSKDNPVSDDVLKRHNIDRAQYEMLVSLYFTDLWMFPMNEDYPTSFKINVKVKEKEAYQLVGDMRNLSGEDLSYVVEVFWQDAASIGPFEYYETEYALFHEADWTLFGQIQHRYSTIVDGKMLYIYAERTDGPLTEKDLNDLKYVVDHFGIEQSRN